MDRLKLAMKGTREQRAQLIRDSNRMVATAVLSSPKLTEAEVEPFAKWGTCRRTFCGSSPPTAPGSKNYGVVQAGDATRRRRPAISMQLLHRLTDKDVKMLSDDRNVPEALRLAARRDDGQVRSTG